MSKTIEMIKSYTPYNDQEEKDKQFFIDCEKVEQILTRDNERCHLCASAFIINKQKTKVLCTYHKIYNSWTWTGGHADGDDDMLYVAKKELEEETSLKNYKLLINDPISIESLPVSAHIKRGKFVPAHIHLNVTYLFEADESEALSIKEDENSGVAWLTFQELLQKSTEPYMWPSYKKIIEKIKTLDYISNLNNFLNRVYPNGKKIVAVNQSDLYLINVFGYDDKHCFSIQIRRLPHETISFYGYEFEETYDLNAENFAKVEELAEFVINNGVRLDVAYKDGKSAFAYELTVKERLSKEDVRCLYTQIRTKRGKTVVPCSIEYSNFLGTQILNIEMS